jgi:uncharacterized membrane protein YcaP (DUF421 family)
MQALRTAGKVRLDQVEVIVLEANGSFSVIPLLSDEDRQGSLEALENIPTYGRRCREVGEERHRTAEPQLAALGLNRGRKVKTPYMREAEAAEAQV